MNDHPSRLVPIGPVWLPRWFVVWGCWTLGVAAVCFVFIDRPVEMLMRYQRPRELYYAADALTDLASSGPYFLGLPILMLVFAVLRRHAVAAKLLLMVASIAAAGIVVNVLKVVFGRYRPNELFYYDQWGFAPISFGYDNASFPSGHAATAAAIITCLCFIFPRLRWFWVSVGVVVALTRVGVSAHFVGDVCAGAFVGAVTSIAMRDVFRSLGLVGGPVRYTFESLVDRRAAVVRHDDDQ